MKAALVLTPKEKVQALLNELAGRKVQLNYPQLVEACKVSVLLRKLADAGVQLDIEAMDTALMDEQIESLQKLLLQVPKPKPQAPRLVLARSV